MKLYKIKKSNIDKNGRGLYATKNIKAGTKIIEYVGNIITKKQTEDSDKFSTKNDRYSQKFIKNVQNSEKALKFRRIMQISKFLKFAHFYI